MPSFKELKKQLEKNRSISKNATLELQKEIEGYTLKECIEKAEILLETDQFAYEVIERGSEGFLGIGKKLYKILVSSKPTLFPEIEKTEQNEDEKNKSAATEIDKNIPIDGSVEFIVRKSGVFLKVSPPKNNGKPLSIDEVHTLLEIKRFNKAKVEAIKSIVRKASNKWVKIGNYVPDAEYDSKIKHFEIGEHDLRASINISPPLFYGRILEAEEIINYLKANEVTFGINKDAIKEIIDKEHYNTLNTVASGKKPENGKNAYIQFHFNIDNEITLKEDDFGKVNFFADLGMIQNVVPGQLLGVKHPLAKGINGTTVKGQEIEAMDGKDVEFIAGKNTRLLENGLEIISESAGRAIYVNNTFEVEPIYKITGNVGLKTGSIVFLGDVHISDSVEDGFSVKASGNIYIGGTIGKSEVEADADIIVQRGIVGKELGLVKAGKNIYAKFIENSKIKAANKVVVTDGILHSNVDAKSVFCLGKRGIITGGRIRATEEVQAKVIGSHSYTETIIEAGIDPQAKEKLIKLEKEKNAVETTISELSQNVITLQKQQQAWRESFPVEKAVTLSKMINNKNEIQKQLEEINQDINEIKYYLHNIAAQGLISAIDQVHPRVEISIKSLTLKVKSPYKHVTFASGDGEIKATPYQKPIDTEEKEKVSEKAKRRS